MDYSYFAYETELGDITLVSNGEALVSLLFGKGQLKGCYREEDGILLEAILEFNQFIAGQRKSFSLPVDPLGSDQEKKVYDYVAKKIPYGKFISYEKLANELGMEVKEVEEALHTNSLPIFVPCHRVIGEDKTLRTYVNDNLKMKRALLKFEHDHLGKDFVAPDYHDDDEDSDPPRC